MNDLYVTEERKILRKKPFKLMSLMNALLYMIEKDQRQARKEEMQSAFTD